MKKKKKQLQPLAKNVNTAEGQVICKQCSQTSMLLDNETTDDFPAAKRGFLNLPYEILDCCFEANLSFAYKNKSKHAVDPLQNFCAKHSCIKAVDVVMLYYFSQYFPNRMIRNSCKIASQNMMMYKKHHSTSINVFLMYKSKL
ncbi:hypothetical protein T08_8320 [Trichinella sp. T8]|nr:hypothetical protein T08_8320 [Trichinella sp. T8]